MRTEPIRRRRRLITRRMIVDTARRLFREEGYRGTTLDMVASELGVTRAALYHWMPSKETLLGEIHDEAMDLLVERFDAIIGADRPAIDKLADAVRNHIITVAENLDTIGAGSANRAAQAQLRPRAPGTSARGAGRRIPSARAGRTHHGRDNARDVQLDIPLVQPRR
jgi:AcrR family transcriptional regulator